MRHNLRQIKEDIFEFIDKTLYLFDCFFFIFVFLVFFIFISIFASFPTENLEIFDILIQIIVSIQVFRMFVSFFSKDVPCIIKEFFLSLIFLFLYVTMNLTYALKGSIPVTTSYKIALLLHSIFYGTYILLTRHRVISFLKYLRLDIFQSFTLGFIFLILIGTYLLSLPYSRTHFISFIDLLFTSTSAVTVAGLATINIDQDLTFFGKTVLLILMQMGGLGIITFSTFYSVNARSKIDLQQRMDTLKLFNQEEIEGVNKLLKIIFISTLIIELVGAGFIYISTLDLNYDKGYHLFFSLFHSISAFCNAGFSTFNTSLRFFYDHKFFLFIMSTLIFLGGIGFLVMMEMKNIIASKFSKDDDGLVNHAKFSPTSLMALKMSFFLMIFGTLMFFFFEKDNVLKHLTLSEALMNSFFQSTTTRTAGFTTTSLVNLHPKTIFLLIILMFIGASPGSTGGGLKTTTFFVLIYTTFMVFSKQLNEEKLSKKRLSIEIFLSAGAVLFLRLCILSIGLLVLVSTQNIPFLDLLFESVSAFSTVGLSLNTTSLLDTTGKIVLMVFMFLGRIGPMHFLSNILARKDKLMKKNPSGRKISLE